MCCLLHIVVLAAVECFARQDCREISLQAGCCWECASVGEPLCLDNKELGL